MQQNGKWTSFGEKDETINHKISKCSQLPWKEYKTRHDLGEEGDPQGILQKMKFDPNTKCYLVLCTNQNLI